MFRSINPANQAPIAEYPFHDQPLAMVDQVARAAQSWRQVPIEERATRVATLAELLENQLEDLANIMSLEMGKPLNQSRGELQKCAWVCRYYAEHGPGFLAHEKLDTGSKDAFIAYQPLGVVFAIMPWNFPFWQVFRFAAPALLAGNGALLKHAPNVGGCALAIERLFHEAGFPEHVFRALFIDTHTTEAIVAHPDVAAVTLTGSTRAGRAVAALAGKHLKKSVLELGGSDPYVILPDADVEQAAAACLTSRLINTGQSCIAAKRLIVVEAVRAAFEEACRAILVQKTFGPALEGNFDLGPLARPDLRDELHRQVSQSKGAGARLLLGGTLPDHHGNFYPATLLTHVRPGMPAFDEETFGPVAAIIPAADESEALQLANQTDYGLGAAVFTRDLDRARHIATHLLNAGACFVNDFVKSDPRLPFGGIKDSGYGRELSHLGIREFMNIKTTVLPG